MVWDPHRLRLVEGAPRRPRQTLARIADGAERLAVERSEYALATLAVVAGMNLALAALFTGAGVLAGDQALLFRELAPGTLLSFAELLLIAAAARAAHRLEAPGMPVWRSFWGLAAGVFVVFAIDEITQALIFLSAGLEEAFELGPRGGFNDLEAVLLTLLVVASALVLLPRAWVLVRHPLALILLLLGGAIGAGSQALDSFATPTRWEFVAEETLKLQAEALLLGGFLLALHGLRAAARDAAGAPGLR